MSVGIISLFILTAIAPLSCGGNIKKTSINTTTIIDESTEIQEDTLIKDLENLLSFEELTASQIINTIPCIDNPDKILLDSDINLRNDLSHIIQEIESTYEMMKNNVKSKPVDSDEPEYWAILIGADFNELIDGLFILDFAKNVKLMSDLLPISDYWDKSHILVLTDEDVNLVNIILAFLWLDFKEEWHDLIFIYYTAHGGKLNFDLKPIDEDDGKDEYITTYYTGVNPFSIITDDLLNYLIDRLESRCVTVLYDSCFSGGMIDSNYRNKRKMFTSCEEDELGLVGEMDFSKYFLTGLQGFAEDHGWGIISARQAFYYAKEKYQKFTNYQCHPIFYDNCQCTMWLTEVFLPPDIPTLKSNSPSVVYVGNSTEFSINSSDPEGDKIRYGFQWNAEDPEDQRGKYGEDADYWTGQYFDSEEICNITYTWNEPGTYHTRVKARDINGSEQLYFNKVWSSCVTTIVLEEEEYTINNKLSDDFVAEDDWSIFDVGIPRSKTSHWMQLLDMFPILQKILDLFYY